MNMRHLTFPFKVKEVSEAGEFSGHCSVFDVIDYYGDVVKPGAFMRTLEEWKRRDALPPCLWQHLSAKPIGPHTLMQEDARGLYCEGRLLIKEIEQAREAHALLKAKVIRGQSIGFDIFEGGMTYDGKTNVWNLTDIDLWENSLVTFPANTHAQVESVKSIEAVKSAVAGGKLPAPSDFEELLRDAFGFSRRAAKHIVSRGYTTLRDAGIPLRDVEEKRVDVSQFNPLIEYLERR